MAEVIAISSKEVAEVLGKRHDNFLRDIRKYIVTLGEDASTYFVESLYRDGLGKERFCYNLTRAGCELIAGRIIGAKSNAFREYYDEVFCVSVDSPVEATDEYTVEEVAKELGCNESTVYRMIKSGKLQATQKEVCIPVTRIFVTAEELEAQKVIRGIK